MDLRLLHSAEATFPIHLCVFTGHTSSFWILLDTLILEVFCELEEDGGAVFLTRCNLIASLAFNNMLGDFCLFKMSSCPREPSGWGTVSVPLAWETG